MSRSIGEELMKTKQDISLRSSIKYSNAAIFHFSKKELKRRLRRSPEQTISDSRELVKDYNFYSNLRIFKTLHGAFIHKTESARIADMLKMKRSTFYLMMDRLERRGLATRKVKGWKLLSYRNANELLFPKRKYENARGSRYHVGFKIETLLNEGRIMYKLSGHDYELNSIDECRMTRLIGQKENWNAHKKYEGETHILKRENNCMSISYLALLLNISETKAFKLKKALESRGVIDVDHNNEIVATGIDKMDYRLNYETAYTFYDDQSETVYKRRSDSVKLVKNKPEPVVVPEAVVEKPKRTRLVNDADLVKKFRSFIDDFKNELIDCGIIDEKYAGRTVSSNSFNKILNKVLKSSFRIALSRYVEINRLSTYVKTESFIDFNEDFYNNPDFDKTGIVNAFYVKGTLILAKNVSAYCLKYKVDIEVMDIDSLLLL